MLRHLAIAMTLLLFCGLASAQVSNEELLEQVRKDFGEVLKPEQAPFLYKNLLAIFTDLAKAQERLAEGAVVSINSLHIVESSQVNAFINTEVKPGIRISRQHAFITTGLIQAMMKGVSVEQGLKNIAGALAHELGRPEDTISEYRGRISIENHYGSSGQQAQELRADIDAVRILREANYPTDALYQSLLKLFSWLDSRESAARAALSSHPQKDFRLTSARLFLTFDRLTNGLLLRAKQFVMEGAAEFQAELEKLIPKNGRYPYKSPRSFHEVVARLDALSIAENVSGEFVNLEYNRLVLSGDRLLEEMEKSGHEMTEGERADFAKFFGHLQEFQPVSADRTTVEIFKPSELRSQINAVTGVSDLGNSPSHESYLLKLKTFRSAQVRDILISAAADFSPPSKRKQGVDDYIKVSKLMNGAHPKLVFEVFGADIAETAALVIKLGPDGQPNYGFTNFIEKFESRHIIYSTELMKLLTDLKPELFSLENMAMFTRVFRRQMALVPMHTKNAEFLKAYRQAVVLAKGSQDPEKRRQMQEAIDDLRKSYSEIWSKRGFYGVYDIVHPDAKIQWDMLFEILGINPEIGRNQIQQEVIRYLKGEVQYEGLPAVDSFRKMRAAFKVSESGEKKWLDWATKNLRPYFRNLPAVDRYYLAKDKELYAQNLRDRWLTVAPTLATQSGTTGNDIDTILKTYGQLIGGIEPREINKWDSEFYFKTLLTFVDELPISLERKRAFFNVLVFGRDIETFKVTGLPVYYRTIDDGVGSKGQFSYLRNESALKKAIEISKKYFGGDSIDYFLSVREGLSQVKLRTSDYFLALDSMGLVALAELQNRTFSSFNDLSKTADVVGSFMRRRDLYQQSLEKESNPYYDVYTDADSGDAQSNSARIQRLKNVLLSKTEGVKLTLPQKYELFLKLTETGPTRKTDELAVSLFNLHDLSEPNKKSEEYSPKEKKRLRKLLEEGRLASDLLSLNVAQVVLEDQIRVMQKQTRVNQIDLYNLIVKDLNQFAPQSSSAKDAFLEKIAWRLKLKGSDLDGFIEDQKTQNWKKANPMLARVGSVLSSQISQMSSDSRLKTIEYLLDPVNNETTLFNDIAAEFERIAYAELQQRARSTNMIYNETELRKKAKRVADILKLKAEAAIRDSSPMERLPLYEVVMTAGKNSLKSSSEWPANITRKFLGYSNGSLEEALLTSFLEVAPAHESAVILSYLLANLGSGKGSAVNLFEVFDTVGIKFGQTGSIWNVFGDKVTPEDAKRLKSQAKPLSRYDILRLSAERDPSIKGKVVDVERLIGSASVKTVSLVQLADGRRVVMLLQGPALLEKIQMNLDLGKRFIANLRSKNIVQNSILLQELIEALESQLTEEVDMRLESEKFARAERLIEALNQDMKSELGGWTFKVPKLIKDMPLRSDMAFYELADGVAFDDLPEATKAELGPHLVKANIKMMFKYGYFEPDRHRGQWMVDLKTKTLWWLDFGQLTNYQAKAGAFKWDQRITLAEFVRAIDARNSKNVLHYAKLMMKDGVILASAQETKIIAQLDRLFLTNSAKADMKQQFLELVETLVNNGVRIRGDFLFGALKGMMVLYGESYASEDVFKKVMKEEITSLLAKKVPALGIEKVRSMWQARSPAPQSTMPQVSGRECSALFGP